MLGLGLGSELWSGLVRNFQFAHVRSWSCAAYFANCADWQIL